MFEDYPCLLAPCSPESLTQGYIFFLSCICLLDSNGHVLTQPSPAGGDIDMGLI